MTNFFPSLFGLFVCCLSFCDVKSVSSQARPDVFSSEVGAITLGGEDLSPSWFLCPQFLSLLSPSGIFRTESTPLLFYKQLTFESV
uniref:Secreted protein n=1 Tax=Panagrolaimus sp. JU765 TaxID=591449 RepID=A0AC34RI10_9BILA